MSDAEARWMPRRATHPSSSLVFLASIVSVVTFHCHVLDRFVSCSKPCPGSPPTGHGFAPPPPSNKVVPGTSGPSSARYPVPETAYGGFTDFARKVKPTGSRAKNWPTPARRTKRALPKTSQATPKRGETRCLFDGRSERYGEINGVTCDPTFAQRLGSPPFGSSMPLQGSLLLAG